MKSFEYTFETISNYVKSKLSQNTSTKSNHITVNMKSINYSHKFDETGVLCAFDGGTTVTNDDQTAIFNIVSSTNFSLIHSMQIKRKNGRTQFDFQHFNHDNNSIHNHDIDMSLHNKELTISEQIGTNQGRRMVFFENCLFLFAGQEWENEFDYIWRFDLKKRVWKSFPVSGDIPNPRQFYVLKKYKQFAIILGGMGEAIGTKFTKFFCDLYFLNLKTFHCKKVFDSNILDHDVYYGGFHCNNPQIVNDQFLVMHAVAYTYSYSWFCIDVKYIVDKIESNREFELRSDIDFVKWRDPPITTMKHRLVDYVCGKKHAIFYQTDDTFEHDVWIVDIKDFCHYLLNNVQPKAKKVKLQVSNEYAVTFFINSKNQAYKYICYGHFLQNQFVWFQTYSSIQYSVMKPCVCHTVKEFQTIDWNIARLVWIAYYKNDQNEQCFWNMLGKDVIKLILRLLDLSVFESQYR